MKNNYRRPQRFGTWYTKIAIFLFWLCIWQIAAILVNNRIALASPVETISAFLELILTGDFWKSVCWTMLRIILGFFAGSVLGISMAALSWKYHPVRSLLSIPVSVIKSVPVASFVVILLIWQGKEFLSSVISALVVFPLLYQNTLGGLDHVDSRMLEVAEVFGLSFSDRLRYFYYRLLYPEWKNAFKLACGMSVKSAVAAEVIGQPLYSVGNGMYRSKIFLDTAGVLAWTLTAVLVSGIFEHVFFICFDRLGQIPKKNGRHTKGSPDRSSSEEKILLNRRHLSRTFGENKILDDVSVSVRRGEWLIVEGASGIGKTTLLRILMGLEKTDDMEKMKSAPTMHISEKAALSACFQEDRLFDNLTALDNIRMVLPDTDSEVIRTDLQNLIGSDVQDKKISELSGGQKRRVCLIRAMRAKSDLVILDEPFTGLDAETRDRCLAYLHETAGDRGVILALHDSDGLEDCRKLTLR